MILRLVLALGALWHSPLETSASDPCSLSIAVLPTLMTVVESQRAVFQVAVDGPEPYSLQWFRNDTPLPGATNTCYTTPRIRVRDSGSTYWVAISNAECQVASARAYLLISPDTAPPQLTGVAAISPRLVLAFFSKEVIPGSPDNYTLIPHRGISAVKANQSDPTVVELTLLEDTPLAAESLYSLMVSSLRDSSGNALDPDPSQTEFMTEVGISNGLTVLSALHVCDRVLICWPEGTALLGADRINGPWREMVPAASPIILDTPQEVCPVPPRFYRTMSLH